MRMSRLRRQVERLVYHIDLVMIFELEANPICDRAEYKRLGSRGCFDAGKRYCRGPVRVRRGAWPIAIDDGEAISRPRQL